MKQGKIALPGQMWEYEAVEERVTRPDLASMRAGGCGCAPQRGL